MKIKNDIESFIKNRKLTLISIAVDIFLFAGCFALAYLIDSFNIVQQDASFLMTMALCAPCLISIISSMFFAKVYRIAWKYAGITELVRLVAVIFLNIGIGMIYRALFTFIDTESNMDNIRLSLLIEAYIFFFFMATSYRIMSKLTKILKKRLNIEQVDNSNLEKVIVYGAGYTGVNTIKRFLSHPEDGYLPVAIIDDDLLKKKSIIGNIEVVGDRSMIEETINSTGATAVIITISELPKKELRAIFDHIKHFHVKILMANPMSDAENTLNKDVVSIRNIKIEDLLHRDEHNMDRKLVDSFIKNKVVMVTGGAGSIGSELCRQALIFGCKHLVIFEQHEFGMFEFNEELKKIYTHDRYSLEMGTVRDKTKVREVMKKYKPDVVFHAAAYKHVPMMEISADESVKNNCMGTKNVIEVCNECDVKKFILVSTDKAINPANVMGATKRTAELILQSKAVTSKTQLAAVRFGNVLGSSGSVIPTFIRQINEGGPITVTDREMQRYFMTIPEAVRLVLQAGALANGGEVFVLNMGEPVFIYDLAKDLVRMSGLRPNVDIEIKITGLRPGEKLFEELQYGNENVDTTRHDDIFVCKLEPVDNNVLIPVLEELFETAVSGNKEMTEELLFKLVPSEYRKKRKDSNVSV